MISLITPAARAQGRRTGRRLVLVDIENALGQPMNDTTHVARIQQSIAEAIGLGSDEQVVIGSSHYGAISAKLGWGGAPRLVVRSGPDGADLALLEVLTTEQIEKRFTEVVLVSGDSIFTDTVAWLGSVGVRVTIATRPESCSKRLRMAAADTIYFTDNTLMEGAA